MGPYNYTVATFGNPKTARALAEAINAYGQWDAILTGEDDFCSVVLPGQCVDGTETYMRGFVEGFMAVYQENP